MFHACLGRYYKSKNAYDDLYTDSNTTYVQTNKNRCNTKKKYKAVKERKQFSDCGQLPRLGCLPRSAFV